MLFTVPSVSSTARGPVLETEGTVFPNTDRPRPMNNIYIILCHLQTKVHDTQVVEIKILKDGTLALARENTKQTNAYSLDSIVLF